MRLPHPRSHGTGGLALPDLRESSLGCTSARPARCAAGLASMGKAPGVLDKNSILKLSPADAFFEIFSIELRNISNVRPFRPQKLQYGRQDG